MHRALAAVAVFKFLIFLILIVISTAQRFDPVLLVSCILMAMSAIITRIVQEGEVGFVLVSLILLIDIIGLLLSVTNFSIILFISYIFFMIWDVQILMLLRQIQT
jgi:hypothetical protein